MLTEDRREKLEELTKAHAADLEREADDASRRDVVDPKTKKEKKRDARRAASYRRAAKAIRARNRARSS